MQVVDLYTFYLFGNLFMLMTSNTLRRAAIPREFFDVQNSEHIKSAKQFLQTGQWGKIQFFVEAPFTNVPDTVLRKLALRMVELQELEPN